MEFLRTHRLLWLSLPVTCAAAFACKTNTGGAELKEASPPPSAPNASAYTANAAYSDQCGNPDPLVAFNSPSGDTPTSAVALRDGGGLGLVDSAAATGIAVKDVFERNCRRCHVPGNDQSPANFNDVFDHTQLLKFINLASPETSRLYKQVLSGSMPEDTGKMQSPDDAPKILAWIKAGAPDFSGAPGAPATGQAAFISEKDKVTCIFNDFTKSVAAQDRPFTRYLTLSHLYDAGVPEAELDRYRQGLAKLTNSLSLGKNAVPLHPVDPAKTIFRIDLRLFKWSNDLWNTVIAADKFVVASYTDPDLGPMLDAFKAATTTAVIFTRGDSLAETGSIPPLYYAMIDIPDTDKALEDKLQVNIIQDIDQRLVFRAGFNDSGVSNNNRLIERHDSPLGYYWKSYDFRSSVGEQNLFARPLGPCLLSGQAATTPTSFLKSCDLDDATLETNNVFKHAGGEIIFSLPNGFQGYLLTNNLGARLDKGPIDIVKDKNRPDSAVIDGLSCMGCHDKGMIRKEDAVRPNVQNNINAFPNQASIIGVYKPQAKLDEAFGKDERRFAAAMSDAGVTAGGDEQVTAMVKRFESTLNAQTAAGELGLTAVEMTTRLKASKSLRQDAGSLLIGQGSINRDTFDALFPALQAGLVDSIPGPAIVGVGGGFACGSAGGVVLCWGDTTGGQTTPTPGLRSPQQLALGSNFGCALNGGNVVCWPSSSVPTDLGPASQITAGANHGCAVVAGGKVRCWGDNASGQTDVPPTLANVAQVASGGAFTCALAAGKVSCWGSPTGNETTPPANLVGVTQIATGSNHACAVAGGKVNCWGDNTSGQTTVPPGLQGVSLVAAGGGAGSDVTCAVAAGKVTCWGSATNAETTVPPGLQNVTQIAVGSTSVCAVADGKIACWGSNSSGQTTVPAVLQSN